MSWIMWVTVLVVWPLVGLGVAYLFGRFTHRGEIYGDAGQLAPPIVSYLRGTKRARVASRVAAQTEVRGEAGGARTRRS